LHLRETVTSKIRQSFAKMRDQDKSTMAENRLERVCDRSNSKWIACLFFAKTINNRYCHCHHFPILYQMHWWCIYYCRLSRSWMFILCRTVCITCCYCTRLSAIEAMFGKWWRLCCKYQYKLEYVAVKFSPSKYKRKHSEFASSRTSIPAQEIAHAEKIDTCITWQADTPFELERP